MKPKAVRSNISHVNTIHMHVPKTQHTQPQRQKTRTWDSVPSYPVHTHASLMRCSKNSHEHERYHAPPPNPPPQNPPEHPPRHQTPKTLRRTAKNRQKHAIPCSRSIVRARGYTMSEGTTTTTMYCILIFVFKDMNIKFQPEVIAKKKQDTNEWPLCFYSNPKNQK